ncbi:MAG: glycosyltransferase family 4 protein [bacterium]|nr:glycosyltransferase family 4 protein [bacterium]
MAFRPFFSQIDAFLAVGRYNRELYSYFGVKDARIFNAPHCVDNDFFIAKAKEVRGKAAELRAEFGIAPGNIVILFVGKLTANKRPQDLLEAVSKSRYRDILHVLMVGDGPYRDNCLKMAAAHGLSNLHMMGFRNQSELPFFYAAGDVLVLPSEHETWGLVINEAMACGLPVIASSGCGAVPDMVVNGKTGFSYQVGDIDVLVELMNRVACRPEVLNEMRPHVLSHIKKFSIDRTVEALTECMDYVEAHRNPARLNRG